MFILTQFGFIVLSLFCIYYLYRELRQALPKTSFAVAKQKRIQQQFIGAWLAWVLVISLLAWIQFFANFSSVPPRFFLVLLIPLTTALLLSLFSSTLAEILRQIPPERLIYTQSFRILVEVLIWLLFVQQLLPIQMTFEGMNFDILTGLTAPFIAYFCFKKKQWPRWVAIAWNVMGLVLVFTIVTIAIFSFPTPFRYFMNEPANRIVAQFPFVWLPGILVTVAYSMHFFSLKQLLSTSKYPETGRI